MNFLRNILSPDHQSNTWGVRLGQMLLAAKKQDAERFYEKLKLIRKEQVVPLSAASYECGTYQRGYEYIVRSVTTVFLCICAVLLDSWSPVAVMIPKSLFVCSGSTCSARWSTCLLSCRSRGRAAHPASASCLLTGRLDWR